jgi:hypothetical protein
VAATNFVVRQNKFRGKEVSHGVSPIVGTTSRMRNSLLFGLELFGDYYFIYF